MTNNFKSAILLTNLGLGDIITSLSAIFMLAQKYDKIVLICKEHNFKNMVDFLQVIKDKVYIQTFDDSENVNYGASGLEYKTINKVLEQFKKCDIFCMRTDCSRFDVKLAKIQSNAVPYYKKPAIPVINFFEQMYENLGLSFNHYFHYFDFPSQHEKLFNFKRPCVFLHTKGSNREFFPDQEEINKWKNNALIICPNKNFYNLDETDYELASTFLNLPITSYTKIIFAAQEIFVIDSVFACIVIPFWSQKKLRAKKVAISSNKQVFILNT